MKRAGSSHGSRIVLVVAFLALAGMAWGAAARRQTPAKQDVAVSKSVTHTAAVPSAAKRAVKKTGAPMVTAPAPIAGEAGMRIFRDPETGQNGPPTSEALRQLAEAESHRAPVDVANLPQVKSAIPGGGFELNSSSIEEAVVMTIDKNGKRTIVCGKDPEAVHKAHAAQLQSQKTAPAPAREDR